MKIFSRHKRSRSSRVYEIAASYALREQTGPNGATEHRNLTNWLQGSPERELAYLEAKKLCAIVARSASHHEFMAMRCAALSYRPQRSVVRVFSTAAGLAAVAVGLAFLLPIPSRYLARAPSPVLSTHSLAENEVMPTSKSAIYRTQKAERSSVALPDGSAVILDTDSAVEVAYTQSERGVRLLRGQALFEVAKHKSLPFRVSAGSRIITAVGTRFDVRLLGSADAPTVRVALLEGVVDVSNANKASLDSASMVAGEVLQAEPSAPMRVQPGDAKTVASWENGALVFNDRPLSEAVEEMNRYTTHPIILADESSKDLRISGVFNTRDPAYFAETIAETFALHLRHDANGAVRLTAKR